MSRKRVLLVEPDERACRAVKEMLEALGYEVVDSGDGDSAVSIFPFARADLVLTAYPLPTSSGASFTEYVKRQSGDLSATIVVGMVGQGAWEQANEAIINGCDDILSKPINPELLGIKLRALIDSSDDSWPVVANH